MVAALTTTVANHTTARRLRSRLYIRLVGIPKCGGPHQYPSCTTRSLPMTAISALAPPGGFNCTRRRPFQIAERHGTGRWLTVPVMSMSTMASATAMLGPSQAMSTQSTSSLTVTPTAAPSMLPARKPRVARVHASARFCGRPSTNTHSRHNKNKNNNTNTNKNNNNYNNNNYNNYNNCNNCNN